MRTFSVKSRSKLCGTAKNLIVSTTLAKGVTDPVY